MFTGLIREMAQVVSLENNFLTIKAKYRPKIGDSIAINGACLTVIKIFGDTFTVELSLESRKHLVLENCKNSVHMEPAMLANDRFEGHIVQGHVDCLGTIKSIKRDENATNFVVNLPKEFIKYIMPKGSIAIDGVSLTINDIFDDSFRLTIISHTIENTLFKNYKIGTRVNIETDMFARYIYNMFKPKDGKSLTWSDVDRVMANY